jgi:hypothetical protein
MIGSALRVWEAEHCGTARFEVDGEGNLVLEQIDGGAGGVVKLNPTWLRAQGYGHHLEDGDATLRVGEHVFRRIRHLADPFAAYRLDGHPAADTPG